jgi:hypothetical protein
MCFKINQDEIQRLLLSEKQADSTSGPMRQLQRGLRNMQPYMNTKQHLMIQLKNIEDEVRNIDVGFSERPPETSNQLLHLRKIQNVYRDLIILIEAAIRLYD